MDLFNQAASSGGLTMKSKCYLLITVCLLLLAAMACSLVADLIPGDETPLPEDVLFRDDFSDPSSGWDRVDTADGVTDYQDGRYRILVNTPNTDVWANPGLAFGDVIVEVDATKAGGPDDNDFGVICRYQDIENFYFFLLSSDGYYGIGRVVDGEQTLIGDDQLYPDDAIRQGEATNHIRADCVGSSLTLHINGVELAEVQDDTFASGDVGLLAGTFDQPGTELLFDDFVVKRP
jgi:hypothetical protein